jgi:DNA polymerase III delta subunit
MRKSLSLRERFLRKHPHSDTRRIDAEDGDFSISKLSESIASGGLFSKQTFVSISDMFSLEKVLRDDVETFFAKTYRSKDDIFVVIREPNVDKRSRLFKTLKKVADSSEECISLEGAALYQWARKYLQEAFPESVWEENAVEELLLRTQNNLSRFACESEKVFLFAQHSPSISRKDVEEAALFSQTISPFSLLDAVGSGEKNRALSEMRKQILLGDDPYKLLGMLAYHIRTVLTVLSHCEERGICDARSIASSEKLKPFVVERVLRNRSKMSLERAKKMLALLGRLDVSAKRGVIDPEFALEEILLRS